MSQEQTNKDQDLTWDQRIAAVVDFGIDESILRENLKLTPTERVEKMLRAAHLAYALSQARRV